MNVFSSLLHHLTRQSYIKNVRASRLKQYIQSMIYVTTAEHDTPIKSIILISRWRFDFCKYKQPLLTIYVIFELFILWYSQTNTGTMICVYAKNMTSPTHSFKWLNICEPSLAMFQKQQPIRNPHITWWMNWIQRPGEYTIGKFFGWYIAVVVRK